MNKQEEKKCNRVNISIDTEDESKITVLKGSKMDCKLVKESNNTSEDIIHLQVKLGIGLKEARKLASILIDAEKRKIIMKILDQHFQMDINELLNEEE